MNKSLIISLVVGLVVVISGGVFYYTANASESKENNSSSSITPSLVISDEPVRSNQEDTEDDPTEENSVTSETEENSMLNESASSSTMVFTRAQLSSYNGDRLPCYTAVDGVVYDMQDFSLWQNGTHSTSGGIANCGQVLDNEINQAPHGKSKLSIMPKVGVMAN
jgi:predicted heme/steroid binding protein